MITIRQNMRIAARRIGRNFWRLFGFVLIFSLGTAIALTFQAVANAWFFSQQGMTPDEIVTYYTMQQAYGEAFFEQYPDMKLITYELMDAASRFSLAVSGVAVGVELVFTLFFALPSAALFLALVNKEPISLRESLKLALKSVPLALLVFIKTFLWSLLFIVPGIIKAISYSQSYFVKYENPDMKASECIKRSCEIMEGRKGYYFGLTMLYALFTVGFTAVGNVVASMLDTVIGVLLMDNANVYALLSNLIFAAAAFVAPAFIGVRQRVSMAIFYVDAKRSWRDNLEQDLRSEHESGVDEDSPFERDFREEREEIYRAFGLDSEEMEKGFGKPKENKHKDIDPFE